jgi:FemAB-related protein (PEP-CTERM system-associated)
MQVERVVEPGAEWDEFAESTPGVCVGHAAAWASVLREAYRLEPLYLAARSAGGEMMGILPLVRFRTLIGRSELISLPYLDAAGILAREPESAEALRLAAVDLLHTSRARTLELRQSMPVGGEQASDPSVDRVNLVLPLEADEEAQWKALRAKVRNQTRKAEKEGLEIAEGTPKDLLDAFYGAFRENMRDLGSPVHAESFFHAAARHLGDRLRFVVTHLGGRPVGGLVAIRYGPAVTVPWASTLRSERRRCPNNLIYWEALRWAIATGATEFDFGRSPRDSGTHRFKLGWGAHEEPLPWLRMSASGEAVPMAVGNTNSLLTRVSELWTRLPVPVASALGSRVRRYFSN